MDIDQRFQSNDEGEDNYPDSSSDHEPEDQHNYVKFINNYTEIYCGSLETKRHDKSAISRSLIQRNADDEFIRNDKEKWTKVFEVNAQYILIVTIQAGLLEVTLKHLYFNEPRFVINEFERVNQRNPAVNSSITKRFPDHSADLLQEAFLQKIIGSKTSSMLQECNLFYCDKNLRNLYCIKMSVSESEFKCEKSVVAINSEYNTVSTFTVIFDYSNDSSVFMFGSSQVDGVLVSNASKFGGKQIGNNNLNLTYFPRVSGILNSIISNKIIKKVRGVEQNQNYCIKLGYISNNLIFGVWSKGDFKIFSGTDSIYEGNLSNNSSNEMPNDRFISNCKISSKFFDIEKDEDGNLEKSFYIAISFVVDNSETSLQIYNISFSGFRADQAIDEKIFNFKTLGRPNVSCIININEYGNKTIVDVQFDEDHLWILTEELTHFNKSGLGMHKVGDHDSCSFPYRTSIQKFRIKRTSTIDKNEYKCLKDKVWTQDDQLILEKVENNEFLDPAIVTDKQIEGRIFRRLGGEYMKDKNLCKNKNYTSKSSLLKMLKELQGSQKVDPSMVWKEYYEDEFKNLKPISLSYINIGENNSALVVIRRNSISILKRNTEFTAYSQYINKTVIDIQASFDKNPDKCRMYLVKNFLRNKTIREKTLSFVALMKLVYSELIVTMDKRFECGFDFPKELYNKPSQHIKFELLSLLRSQLTIHGGKMIFEECLQMLNEFEFMIQKTIQPNSRFSKSISQNCDIGSFFTQMLASNAQSEIKCLYEFNRDVLWFVNWMIKEDLDDKDFLKYLTDPNPFSKTRECEGYINRNRKEVKHFEQICRSLLCISILSRSDAFMYDQIIDYLSLMRIEEPIGSIVNINEYFFASFIILGLFSCDSLEPTTIPLLIKQQIQRKQYFILERALLSLKERNPALNFALAICKSYNGDVLGFQKYFGTALTEISTYSEAKNCMIEEHIFNNSEYDEEFTNLVQNVNNPMIVFAKSCIDQINQSDYKTLICGLKLALSYRYDIEDSFERKIVDMLWQKMHMVSKEINDVSIAITSATSISDDKSREAILGSLFEDLLVKDNIKELSKSKLSEKNFAISIKYLQDKIIDSLNRILIVNESDDTEKYESMFTYLMKFIRFIDYLYCFYSKPRESCKFMLTLYFHFEETIQTIQRNMLAKEENDIDCYLISLLLDIENQILSKLLSLTNQFETPERYSFYIKENDIYSIIKRKSAKNSNDSDMEESLITSDMASRVFEKNTDEGKYTINLSNLRAFIAKNEAQIEIIHRIKLYVCDINDIIDYCTYLKLYETAINVCKTHNRNPEIAIQLMALDYCELYNQLEENEDYAEEELKIQSLEDAEFSWQIDPEDVPATQVDVLLNKIIDTISDLDHLYPQLQVKALEIFKANLKDINKLDRKMWSVFDKHNPLIQEIIR